jgi:hypothetical protein
MRKSANPAWVDDALELNWESMKNAVGQRWMPVAHGGAAAAHASGFEGMVYREYGSGNYGTVFPTRDPGVVLKITRDATEANLVAYTVDNVRRELRGRMPEGLVRYYRIMQLKTNVVPIYAIWREAALSTGREALKQLEQMHDHGLPCNESGIVPEWLHEYRIRADYIRKYQGSPTELYERSEYWKRWTGAVFRVPEGQEAAFALAGLPGIIETISKIPCLKAVGQTFSFYLKRGVVLADVHINNVGLVKRARKTLLVITDPGHAVFLQSKQYRAPALVANRGRRR